MKGDTKMTLLDPDLTYGQIYSDTSSMITVLSGLTKAALDDAAIELNVDYEIFVRTTVGLIWLTPT